MWKYFLLLTLPLYVLDQITKRLIQSRLELGEAIQVIPGFFDIVHWTNTGAAFGMFSNNNLFFICLSAVALTAIVIFWRKKAFDTVLQRAGASLIASGILGNLTDRLDHGHVVDFLLFYIGRYQWPAFNVADSCICVAAAFFLIASFRPAPKRLESES